VSYQVLARKYRPRGFDDVIGQDHVTTPLRNAVRTGRIPHAILLTGPRGTGKTTLARIFACCLNAEKGPTDAPDPEDPACLEIQAGSSTDVQEIDAASRTSVDDVREIIESIRYAAAPGKHRIFIVDEVHMLSTPAFNALLKTLEEPPPQSLFLFCTTNPEKIPFTVVSRCQRYDLRRIATAEIARNLAEVAGAEGLRISESSLLAVARAGDGSMRDALTLLDQLIAFGGEEVDDQRVAEVLDLIDRAVLTAIVTACLEGDPAAALTACRRAWETGVDAKRLGGELLGLLRDLVVLRVAPEAGLVEGADAELEALRSLAERAEEARLRRMFRALLREQEDLAWAPEPFAVLEVALIRLATMPAGDQVEQLLARIDALERELRGSPGGGSAGPAPTTGGGVGARARAGGGGRATAAPPATERSSAATAASDLPGAAAATGAPNPPVAPAASDPPDPAGEPAASRASGPPQPQAPLPQVFDRLRAFAQEANRGLFAALEGGRLLERSDTGLRIELPSALAQRRLAARRAELHGVCARFFGRELDVELEIAREVPSGRGPSAEAAASEADQVGRRQRQEALNHPAVNDALEILQAEIVEIRPLGGPGPMEAP